MRDCRVDAFVHSQVFIDSWYGQGSKNSLELTNVTKDLFIVLAARNLQLNLFHVSSRENSADGPSRAISLSDSRLSLSAWAQVEQAFGGVTGHTFVLMTLDSNAVCGWDGVQLRHFSPTLSPHSEGVNLFCQDLGNMDNMSNPYVFPPFALLGPVLKFLYRFGIPFSGCCSIFPASILVAGADGPFLGWHLSGYSGRHRCPSGAIEVRLHESSVSSFVVGFSDVSILGRTLSALCVYRFVLGVVTDQFFGIPFQDL